MLKIILVVIGIVAIAVFLIFATFALVNAKKYSYLSARTFPVSIIFIGLSSFVIASIIVMLSAL